MLLQSMEYCRGQFHSGVGSDRRLIGLFAVLLMLLTGQIAGIFGDLLDFRNGDKGFRITFIAGLILAL
jgi:hypothetical protein